MSKGARNREIARQKLAELRAAEARRKRRNKLLAWAGGSVVAVGAVVGIVIAVTANSGSAGATNTGHYSLAALSTLGSLQAAPPAGPNGPEGVPVPAGPALASTASAATGQKVDGISCQTNEQTIFHIHAHLTIFVNGSAHQVPAAIGIPGARAQNTAAGQFIGSGTCFYWLHTHAADGIVHIESPVHRTYTLGNFFDEWGQPLGPNQVGPAKGHVVAIYNGKVFQGNPRFIPLTAHAQIQLEVGTPLVAPETITFPNGL